MRPQVGLSALESPRDMKGYGKSDDILGRGANTGEIYLEQKVIGRLWGRGIVTGAASTFIKAASYGKNF